MGGPSRRPLGRSNRRAVESPGIAPDALPECRPRDGPPPDPAAPGGDTGRHRDLADDAYVLVAATLPRDQECAIALTAVELGAIGLPGDYPADGGSGRVSRSACPPIGVEVKRLGLRGLLVRSAVNSDGRGTELAWFPATTRSRAHPDWKQPRTLSEWIDAESSEGVGLEPQVPIC